MSTPPTPSRLLDLVRYVAQMRFGHASSATGRRRGRIVFGKPGSVDFRAKTGAARIDAIPLPRRVGKVTRDVERKSLFFV